MAKAKKIIGKGGPKTVPEAILASVFHAFQHWIEGEMTPQAFSQAMTMQEMSFMHFVEEREGAEKK